VRLRIGTRGSALALAQAALVADALRALGAEVEVVPIRTAGDRLAQVALADLGGKALFVKEIEDALVERRVDLAVHSLKDLPADLPPGLALAACAAREDPRDVAVTQAPGGLGALAPGAVVGTSSPRRRALLLAARPDLAPAAIRGNVETRLAKLERGEYAGLVLASAGLRRLGLAPPHAAPLDPEEFVPAVGQGIVAIEAREQDAATLALLDRVNDTQAMMAALAERALMRGLGAGCHTPVAGYARLVAGELRLTGLVASPDGRTVLRGAVAGPPARPAGLGAALAETLMARGAGPLLAVAGRAP
jgi:hydroxymethylbilane synthase